MRLASYNVNSIKVRKQSVAEWLETAACDAVMLQELKVDSDQFPVDQFPEFVAHVHGQPTYNGVATLVHRDYPSRLVANTLPPLPVEQVVLAQAYFDQISAYGGVQLRGLYANLREDFAADRQARFLDVAIDVPSTAGVEQTIRVCNIYLPNGNPALTPIDTLDSPTTQAIERLNDLIRGLGMLAPPDGYVFDPKFVYKCIWMFRLSNYIENVLLSDSVPFVIAGDFNICPTADDLYDAAKFQTDALCQPQSRQWYRSLHSLGLTEMWRALHPAPAIEFSYWDYRGGAFSRGEGLRIDHFQASPQMADWTTNCSIDPTPRSREQASDHTPVILDLDVANRAILP